jgi:ATP-dependent DNA helicase RecG
VRFRPSRYIAPRQVKQDLTERQRLILQLLSERPGIGRKEILAVLKLEVRALKHDLEDLKRMGVIIQDGKGRGSVWHLAETAVDRQ